MSTPVDAGKPIGQLTPIWRFSGEDGLNYAYMKDGKAPRRGEIEPLTDLFSDAQSPHHRRQRQREEHQCHTEAPRQAGLRLTIVDRIFDATTPRR
jgi:hypothetical protein